MCKTHAYLFKISMTHNKKQIPLLNSCFNFISARSATQIFCKKDEFTFCFSKFLIIGFCNSSANSWFNIFSFLTPPLEADLSVSKADFLSKNF